jgi:foldase protein PrsA
VLGPLPVKHSCDTSPRRRARRRLAGGALAVVGRAGVARAVAGCGGATAKPVASPQPEVAARVNGQPIFKRQVAEAQAEARLGKQQLSYSDALDQLIGEELLRQEARRLHVTVPATDIEARYRQVAASSGGEEALLAALKSGGLTADQLKRRIEVVLLQERLAAAKFADRAATLEQAKTYYDRHRSLFRRGAGVRLGDINVKSENLALGVIDWIDKGHSFKRTASQYIRSDGMLGWISVASLPKPMAEAVARMRVGQISRPVQALGDWHVLKLYGRRAAVAVPFAQVEKSLRAQLTKQRQLAALVAWAKKARAAATVEKLP